MSDEQLREALAEYAHEAWSGWMKYLFSKGYFRNIELDGVVQQVWIMPGYERQRWQRQMNTPYAELPEEEKASDRDEADKMLEILQQARLAAVEKALKWVRLEDLPPGIVFATQDGALAVKSEYTILGGQCRCILLGSGEYAHFANGNDTLVCALEIQEPTA